MKKDNVISSAQKGTENFHLVLSIFFGIALIGFLVFLFGVLIHLDQGSRSPALVSFFEGCQVFAFLMAFVGAMLLFCRGAERTIFLNEEEVSECLGHSWAPAAKALLLKQFQKNGKIRMHHVLQALSLQENMAKRVIKENKAVELQRQKESNSARFKSWEKELSSNT